MNFLENCKCGLQSFFGNIVIFGVDIVDVSTDPFNDENGIP